MSYDDYNYEYEQSELQQLITAVKQRDILDITLRSTVELYENDEPCLLVLTFEVELGARTIFGGVREIPINHIPEDMHASELRHPLRKVGILTDEGIKYIDWRGEASPISDLIDGIADQIARRNNYYASERGEA